MGKKVQQRSNRCFLHLTAMIELKLLTKGLFGKCLVTVLVFFENYSCYLNLVFFVFFVFFGTNKTWNQTFCVKNSVKNKEPNKPLISYFNSIIAAK